MVNVVNRHNLGCLVGVPRDWNLGDREVTERQRAGAGESSSVGEDRERSTHGCRLTTELDTFQRRGAPPGPAACLADFWTATAPTCHSLMNVQITCSPAWRLIASLFSLPSAACRQRCRLAGDTRSGLSVGQQPVRHAILRHVVRVVGSERKVTLPPSNSGVTPKSDVKLNDWCRGRPDRRS